MKSAAEQYKHQKKYFDKEFSEIKRYTLDPWQESYVKKVKRNLLHRNYKGKRLVDVATGRGHMAIEMARLGLKVLGCDLSKESVRNLNKYKKELALSNLKGKQCGAEKVPIASSSVDYIVANAILEHIPDERAAIAEWLRVLKPKGRLFITVPLKHRYTFPLFYPINVIYDKRIGHLRRYDLRDLETKFGLKAKKVFYTGHLLKMAWLVLSIFVKSKYIDRLIEDHDAKKSQAKTWASNIIVIFEKS